MKTSACHALLAIAVCTAAPCRADTILRDDFFGQRRYERLGSQDWRVGSGECRFVSAGRESLLIANLGDLAECRITTTMTVAHRRGGAWSWGGIVLYADSGNSWKLLLVAGPKGRRYPELVERYRGTHQAQNKSAASGTRLTSKNEGSLAAWEYGQRYKLTLSLDAKAITGRVEDAASGQWWQRTYYFSSGKAVRRGRPALAAAGLEGAFGALLVEGQRPKPMPGLDVARGPQGAAVILDDESGSSAKRLSAALAQAGFGVKEVSWSDLGKGRIPVESVDLLVLADARRLPVAAKAQVTSFLRDGGKLVAVGAPAFGAMLAFIGRGWVGKDRYGAAIVQGLKAKPIALAHGPWRRTAMDRTRSAEIVAEADGWRISADLKGWDGFYKDVAEPFPEGHSLTVFWAKGDEHTPQLSIEWREKDGSRWIGAVNLSTEWRAYAMRPGEFGFWPDCKAKRGRAGDCFNPQNAASITIALSGSHTPKCKQGPHTYWVRGLSWARPLGGQEPDFDPPEIETLSPSYKLYPLADGVRLAAASEQGALPADWRMEWSGEGYSPIWRERGRGFDRGRPWRWVPVVEAVDAQGRSRGALVSMLVGNNAMPDAIVANVAVAAPAQLDQPKLMDAVVATAKAMTRGAFMIEAGSRQFSYRDRETVDLGVEAANLGRAKQRLDVKLTVTDSAGRPVCEHTGALDLAPRQHGTLHWQWTPKQFAPDGYTVTTVLSRDGQLLDRIVHRIERLGSAPAKPEDFVSVRGSNFYRRGRKWFMRGMNYRPSMVGGYYTLDVLQRPHYDPEIIERDLNSMQALGINFISALHALLPPEPDKPESYRDLLDFLDRCQRHGMTVFYFLPWGRPFRGADVEKIKRHIEIAGLKDHPAIMSWELAWEPIESLWRNRLRFIKPEWNRWIVERYGSIDYAERDWGYKTKRDAKGQLEVPDVKLAKEHGEWDRMMAAFRRCFSDVISAKYRDIVNELRAFDPKHLITFRGGACGIPYGERFAHLHSVGVAKHVDFLCPEGYNLRTVGWGNPTPGDDIRKGGLITLYYRFVSREKPVVWMEFGYTIRGCRGQWRTDMVHNDPAQLECQAQEFEHFYKMFVESGARGAAPWWLPGGYRLGERSDFGMLDPDGAERPACKVIRRWLPQFAKLEHASPDAWIEFDLDAHYADSWPTYGDQYLALVKAGKTPYIRTRGTGTDSADTPLIAVGDTRCNGHNPPKYLDAEFNNLEVFDGRAWRVVKDGDKLTARRGAEIRCRASVGNIAEAKWLAPRPGLDKGGVYLAGRAEYGLEFKAPIAADARYLADAAVAEFTLIAKLDKPVTVSFEMLAHARTYFGERRTVKLCPAE